MIKDLNFLAMVQEEFNEVFPNMLEIFYHDCKDKYETSLRRIWEKEWKEHDNISWYKSFEAFKEFEMNAYNRETNQTDYEKLYILSSVRIERYSEFIHAMSNAHNEFCKMYWNSKYAEEDAKTIIQNRLDKILVGIDISKIKINLICEPANVSKDNATLEIFVQLYDECTTIKSDKVSIFLVGHNFSHGSKSIINFRNEQKIRAMVKQFIEDVR